jgi:hypothetical protein
MANYKDKSNMELEAAKLALNAEHVAIKNRILKELDNLEIVETEFKKVESTLIERTKGNR